jgi:thioredoxin reductase (NADPH)
LVFVITIVVFINLLRINSQSKSPMEGARFHVAVVGGGPAGLQAALVFARANIPLVLIDDGNARNKYSHGMHNLVSRDGMSPAEFKRISRDQLKEKCGDHVTFIDDHVVDIQGEKGDFNLVLANAASVRAHRVLLTNGVAHDTLPDVSGVKQLWGEAVFVCPFCDAYERGRDTHFAVLAHSHTLANVPILLKLWCKRITVFSHNTRDVVTTELREKFKGLGVDVIDGEVTNVTGDRAGVTVHTANAKVDANSLWVMSHFTPTELV